MKPHPLPIKVRNVENDDTVGWFMVAFNDAPDHEYSFAVHANGDIVAEGLQDEYERREMKLIFPRMLTDANLRSVRFIQRGRRGDRHVEHNPYS